jgi:hypothetical protein
MGAGSTLVVVKVAALRLGLLNDIPPTPSLNLRKAASVSEEPETPADLWQPHHHTAQPAE